MRDRRAAVANLVATLKVTGYETPAKLVVSPLESIQESQLPRNQGSLDTQSPAKQSPSPFRTRELDAGTPPQTLNLTPVNMEVLKQTWQQVQVRLHHQKRARRAREPAQPTDGGIILVRESYKPPETASTRLAQRAEEGQRASKVRLKIGKRTNRIQVVDEAAQHSAEDRHYVAVRTIQQAKRRAQGKEATPQLLHLETADLSI